MLRDRREQGARKGGEAALGVSEQALLRKPPGMETCRVVMERGDKVDSGHEVRRRGGRGIVLRHASSAGAENLVIDRGRISNNSGVVSRSRLLERVGDGLS